jgi:SAM-dependent methyltransferase
MVHRSASRGFARASEAYERGRPGYPPEAVARLARELELRPGRVVLDLAAGTGKLTAHLVGTGAELVAVEPVAEMRAVIERALPGVAAYAGTAEEIPLETNSVDAVTVAQAFHWFSGEEALVEIHRVVRPGVGSGSSGTSAIRALAGSPGSPRSSSRTAGMRPRTAAATGVRRSSERLCSSRSATPR